MQQLLLSSYLYSSITGRLVICMGIKMRERICKQNKRKRQQEVKRQITLLLFTVTIVLVLAVTMGSFLSKAKDSKTAAPSFKYYTSILIEPGSSLSSIAAANSQEHYASADEYVEEVMQINSLEDEYIHAGQYLIVPYYSETFK